MQTLRLGTVTTFDAVDYRHCQHLVGKVGSESGDVFYDTAVRWLSRNVLLIRFFHIRKERVILVMQKCTTVQKSLLKNGSLLSYVIIYVNEHDLTFQGKVRLLCDVFSDVSSLL